VQKPYRNIHFWSLLEIMKLFDSRTLTWAFDSIEINMGICEENKKSGKQQPNSRDLQKDTAKLVQDIREFCQKVGFVAAAEKAALTRVRLDSIDDLDYSSILTELHNVKDMLFSAQWNHQFVLIPEEFKGFVVNDDLFGPEVSIAFKSAVPDIREAGNCIAVDMGTAAVFHLMRAVEWGLRALCRHLGVLRVPHNKKHIPIEYATWDNMLQKVQEKIDKKIDALGPGKRKQGVQEFYYPLLKDFKGFKDAWRNHVMHSRKTYTQKEAEAIFEHVKNFMILLSTKVKE
jgi:hypothetical protein